MCEMCVCMCEILCCVVNVYIYLRFNFLRNLCKNNIVNFETYTIQIYILLNFIVVFENG